MTLRHFLRDDDLSAAEQHTILDRALALKAAPFSDRSLEGPQVVAVLFDKQTLRTQVSFTAAIAHLGGFPMVIDGKLAQVGVRELADLQVHQHEALQHRVIEDEVDVEVV